MRQFYLHFLPTVTHSAVEFPFEAKLIQPLKFISQDFKAMKKKYSAFKKEKVEMMNYQLAADSPDLLKIAKITLDRI